MNTAELKLALPLGLSVDEAKLLLALKSYETGKLSLGQAATLSGFSKRAFMDVLGVQGIPIADYGADELEQEVALCEAKL